MFYIKIYGSPFRLQEEVSQTFKVTFKNLKQSDALEEFLAFNASLIVHSVRTLPPSDPLTGRKREHPNILSDVLKGFTVNALLQ